MQYTVLVQLYVHNNGRVKNLLSEGIGVLQSEGRISLEFKGTSLQYPYDWKEALV